MKQAVSCGFLGLIVGFSWGADVVFDDASGDPLMGLWAASGKQVQVIGLGSGQYRLQVFTDLEHRIPPLAVLDGSANPDGSVAFIPGKEGTIPTNNSSQKPAWWPVPAGSASWKAIWKDNVFTLTPADGPDLVLTPTPVVAPSLGLTPPADAVVLLSATSTAENNVGPLAPGIAGSACTRAVE